ncbi:hypothetical protein ScalyP_jg1693 [Parmales sp. scaly parma]|nr:hypothetical protein ScalyP_jg1693 [Parmales sp. scaly parma]|tara:strand:+ start:1380 stop:2456 length:1077 start_codon:yes stop_codon:yes gene_type:complete
MAWNQISSPERVKKNPDFWSTRYENSPNSNSNSNSPEESTLDSQSLSGVDSVLSFQPESHDLSAIAGKAFETAVQRSTRRKNPKRKQDLYAPLKQSFLFDPKTNHRLNTANNVSQQLVEPFWDDVGHWNRSNCGWTMSRVTRFSSAFSSIPSFSQKMGGDRQIRTAAELVRPNTNIGNNNMSDGYSGGNSLASSISDETVRRRSRLASSFDRPKAKESRIMNLGQTVQYDPQNFWKESDSPGKSSMFKSSSKRDLFENVAFGKNARELLVKHSFHIEIKPIDLLGRGAGEELLKIKKAENKTSPLRDRKKSNRAVLVSEFKMQEHIPGTKSRIREEKGKSRRKGGDDMKVLEAVEYRM